MQKILIIDDNKKELKQVKLLLNEINRQTSNRYDYFPKEYEDYVKILQNFNLMNCSEKKMVDSSRNYLLDLTNGVDLILLDYQIIGSVPIGAKIKTGLDLYKELDLESKALIYTKSSPLEIRNIKHEIFKSGLQDKIDVISKQLGVNEEAVSYLRENIERMLK